MTTCSNCGQAIDDQVKFCPSCGTQVVGSLADSLIGRTLNGKYRLLEQVGTGSMGTVYLGEHIGLHKKVALKILRPELDVTEETLQRFQREGIAAGKFSHPNAIQIFDFDRADERVFYLAMEFVDGPNLKQFLLEEGRLTPTEAVDLVSQILRALAEAHGVGIVHRDLKPENVMVMRGADGELSVKVLDFGLSKLINLPLGASLQTQTGQIMGTPMYMAPEQGSGEEVDARSDLYAVGLILYELLAGEQPFRADNLTQLMIKQATEPVPSLVESRPELPLPHALDEILERALEKDRDERFQSAAEMLDALDDVDFDRLADPRRQKKRRRRPDTGRVPSTPPARGWMKVAGVLLLAGAGIAAAWKTGFLDGDAGADVARVSMLPDADRSEEETRYVRLLDEARRSARIGETDVALTRIEEAHGMPCRDSEAFLVRALISRARDDDDAALVDLKEALRIDPSYADAAAEIGWMHLDRRDMGEALASFEQAAAFDEDSAQASAGIGVVTYLRGDPERARGFLVRARFLDPGEPRAALYLGRILLEDENFDAAIEALVQAKLNDPLAAEPYAVLGEAYLEAGRLDDAETQLREAVRRGPDSLDALTHLGALLVHTERYSSAIDVLEAALRRHPDWGRPRALLAIALGEKDRDREALEALERTVLEGEGDARVLTLLGIQHQRNGDHDAAIEKYDNAIWLDETYGLPHLNKGLALFALGRYDEALVELESAVELAPEDAFAHYALGILHMEYVGGREQALEHFDKYEELGGSDPRVAGWIEELGR